MQDDIFIPTSAWLVGPATLVPASGQPVPCVMANQYNNGFLFRFSGGGRRLYAMAVDFRQQAFTPGQRYTIRLSVGNDFRKTIGAEAYDAATLLINLQSQPEIYKLVAAGGTLRLGIGRKNLDFALLGAGDGIKRLESCFNPRANAESSPDIEAVTMQSHTAPSIPPVPPIAKDTDGVDPAYQQAVGDGIPNSASDALPADSGDDNAAPRDSSGLSITVHPLAAAADGGAKPESDTNAASLGMHSLTSPVQPQQDLTVQAKKAVRGAAKDAPAADQAADPAADPNAGEGSTGSLIDRMLKKAAAGISGLAPSSGGAGLEDAVTPQPPKVSRVSGAGRLASQNLASNEAQPQYEAVTATDNDEKPSPADDVPFQKTVVPLAGNWTSAKISRADRDIIDGAPPRTMAISQQYAVAEQPQSQFQSQDQTPPVTRQWQAVNGSNLHDILTIWAQNEHVKLVWDAGHEYDVKQSMNQQGSFDNAVQNVMQQYGDDPSRPVAQIYKDPSSGQKTLVVR